MNTTDGIIGKIYQWFGQTALADGTPMDWLAGVIVLILAGFLWSTVVKQTVS